MSETELMHAVAVVVERDRGFAIPIDDERRVLEDLPAAFDEERCQQPHADRPAPRDEPQRAVESEAVNDVRERVPVGQVLRVLRAEHDAVPQLDVAALADRHSAHPEQHSRDGSDDDRCGSNERCGRDTRERAAVDWTPVSMAVSVCRAMPSGDRRRRGAPPRSGPARPSR